VVNLGWESVNSVKNWSNNDWHLLEDRVGGEEHSVLLGPLLDEFLVLVELLEGIEGGDIALNVVLLDFELVLGIGDEADLEGWSWDIWESDGSDETLVLLWIVVLKTDLELNSLSEFSFLGGLLAHLDDVLENDSVVDS